MAVRRLRQYSGYVAVRSVAIPIGTTIAEPQATIMFSYILICVGAILPMCFQERPTVAAFLVVMLVMIQAHPQYLPFLQSL